MGRGQSSCFSLSPRARARGRGRNAEPASGLLPPGQHLQQQQPQHQHRRDSDSGGGAGALCPAEPAVPQPRVRHRHSLGSGGRGSATTMNCLVLLPRAAHPGRAGDTLRGPRRRRRAPFSFGSISTTFSSSSSTFSSCFPPSPAADPGRCFPDPGCRGAREGWWLRRTHFWRTSSGAPVVRRVAVQNIPHLHPAHGAPVLSCPSHPSPKGGGGVGSGTWWPMVGGGHKGGGGGT